MKKIFLIPAMLIPVLLTAQLKEFIVEAGAQRTLTSTERTLSLKTLSLGDNATIIIPPTMDGWTVTATDASIGNNVRIIGVGVNGYNGMPGTTGINGQNYCLAGYPGGKGGNGTYGTPGKNVSLNLKIRSIGKLTVSVKGGNGGNGGNGGYGGQGGKGTCTCNAGTGGTGGGGGNAGMGGNGGNVSITYSKIGNVDVSSSNFIVENTGGSGGYGGLGGAGGAGGAASGCTDPKGLKSVTGSPGLPGAGGSGMLGGKNGTTTIKAL